MCDDHHQASGAEHGFAADWRRSEETSRAEVIPLEPVSSLTISYLVDNVADALLPDDGPARRAARVPRTQPCQLIRGGHALDPLTLPLVLHPESFTRRRLPVAGHDPFEMPVLSRDAVRGAGFEVIEQHQPSFLFSSSVLITGEVDRTTDFERRMSPAHQAYRAGRWAPDQDVIDDQALIVNLRGAGLVNLARYAARLTGTQALRALVGGFHLSGYEPAFPRVVSELAQLQPDVLAPAHCVSHRAMSLLSQSFPDALIPHAVGTTYTFGAPARS